MAKLTKRLKASEQSVKYHINYLEHLGILKRDSKNSKKRGIRYKLAKRGFIFKGKLGAVIEIKKKPHTLLILDCPYYNNGCEACQKAEDNGFNTIQDPTQCRQLREMESNKISKFISQAMLGYFQSK